MSQKATAMNEVKNSWHQQIKTLLDKALPQVNKYKKVTYWCSDETRVGLHTIRRRKLTLSGVKPLGKHQWKFECFWLYGAVSSAKEKKFFLGVFAFRQSLFGSIFTTFVNTIS